MTVLKVPPAVRRIGVGLHECKVGCHDKENREIFVGILTDKLQDRSSCVRGYTLQKPLPLPPVIVIQFFPAVQHGWSYAIDITDLLDRQDMTEVNRENDEDVKKTVLVIGNDRIREDGMGSSTGADNSGDCNPVILWLSFLKID